MSDSIPIYRYGRIAWVWRTMIAGALGGGLLSLVAGVRLGEPALLVIAATLLLPASFLGSVVAVRIDQASSGSVDVQTLLFWRRNLPRARLGAVRVRDSYEGEYGPMYAPHVWVPVRRALPIYLDLLATIPDRKVFAAVFSVPLNALPRTPSPGS